MRIEEVRMKHRSLGITQIQAKLNKKEIYCIETPPSMIVHKQWWQYISYAEATRVKIENPELNVRLATKDEQRNLGAIETKEIDIWEKLKKGLA